MTTQERRILEEALDIYTKETQKRRRSPDFALAEAKEYLLDLAHLNVPGAASALARWNLGFRHLARLTATLGIVLLTAACKPEPPCEPDGWVWCGRSGKSVCYVDTCGEITSAIGVQGDSGMLRE